MKLAPIGFLSRAAEPDGGGSDWGDTFSEILRNSVDFRIAAPGADTSNFLDDIDHTCVGVGTYRGVLVKQVGKATSRLCLSAAHLVQDIPTGYTYSFKDADGVQHDRECVGYDFGDGEMTLIVLDSDLPARCTPVVMAAAAFYSAIDFTDGPIPFVGFNYAGGIVNDWTESDFNTYSTSVRGSTPSDPTRASYHLPFTGMSAYPMGFLYETQFIAAGTIWTSSPNAGQRLYTVKKASFDAYMTANYPSEGLVEVFTP